MTLPREGKSKRIWVTWENQRRNLTLSKVMEAELFQFDLKLHPFIRYFVLLSKTLWTFIKERPGIIFVQNPSIVLAFFAVNYGKVLNIPVIVDAHNAGLFPFEGQKRWANWLSLYLISHAKLTIVTNENLKKYVESKSGVGLIIPDPIPDFNGKSKKTRLKGKLNLMFICTYAQDEPYMEVIMAAKEIDPRFYIYVTGKNKGRVSDVIDLVPDNIILTGFLPESDYIDLLHSVDFVIDLTTREDCLVCGAYEAVAAEKPMILSNTDALRQYFSKGALYVNNTSKDLLEKIKIAVEKIEILKREVKELKIEKIEDGYRKKASFEEILKVMNIG